mgnify:CR=1 FL=1
MSGTPDIEALVGRSYRHGFVTDIESDTVPPGLDPDVIRFISRKKGEPQFLLDWRLKAFRHWLKLREPRWAHLLCGPVDASNFGNNAEGSPPGLQARVDALEADVAALRATVQRLCNELGLPPEAPTK